MGPEGRCLIQGEWNRQRTKPMSPSIENMMQNLVEKNWDVI